MNIYQFGRQKYFNNKIGTDISYRGIFSLVLVLIAFTASSFAQDRQIPGGLIDGRVMDEISKKPIEYASVILFSNQNGVQIAGVGTDQSGRFKFQNLKPGEYNIQISFLGYQLKTIDSIKISRDARSVELGNIFLTQSAIKIDGIRVESEKPSIEYRIDKKVINVENHYTATGGMAVDVLKDAPSVTVDIDGNVSLRGSSNFTVLIDGNPSIMDANDVLEQTPASAIENIEIITNPSAKYDPDGAAGIINIVMKKGKLKGVSSVVNSKGGFDHNYGSDFLVNYKTKRYSTLLGVDYNKRTGPGTSSENNWTKIDDITSYLSSSGSSERNGTGYGIRSGLEIYLSSRDNLSLGFRYGDHNWKNNSRLDYDEWSDDDSLHALYESWDNSERSGNFYATNLNYRHKFSDNGHELSGQAVYNRREMNENQKTETFDIDKLITFGQITEEDGPADNWRIKLDYTLPIDSVYKLEMGYQSRLGRSDKNNDYYEYDTLTHEYDFLTGFSHSTKYADNIHSLYAILGGGLGRLGYQVGFRSESTYRNIELLDSGEAFKIDRWDYFPSLHLSYKLDQNRQLMTSYSRKIERPRDWWLEPFETWTDAYNVRRGNPDLLPEYIDSYEFGFLNSFGRNMFSVDAYYRVTDNKTDFIRTVYSENVTLNTVENVGTDYSLGTELMLNLSLFKRWDLNLNANLFHYRISGELDGDGFSNDDFSWNARMNNTVSIGRKTKLQLNGRYMSKSASSQGQRKGHFMTDLAIKHDIISKVFSATLQVNDIFGTGRHEAISEGPDYYKYSLRERKSPSVMLTLSYIFNNFRQERDRDQINEDMGEEDF